ncbi:hypothetical protein AB0E69_12650 [Kribbella sp. NPDC026611]|uniref:hypothetical protein n=1 Tax=Kribbella sp. NPDC026611 TaxID=3154911 RepID=UPI0033F9D8EE
MTILDVPASAFDPRAILGLGLPAHVDVLLDQAWTSAWLIGRLHCADGWIALIQYVDSTGYERTVRIPADRVSLPTVRPHRSCRR